MSAELYGDLKLSDDDNNKLTDVYVVVEQH